MTAWGGVAEGYRHSFARACAGGIEPLVAATSGAGASSPRGSGARLRHLDVGCGDGRLAEAASAAGRSATACDADLGMCRMTRASVPEVPVVNAALPELPWRAGSFDVVTANFVINHVDDPRSCVREMARACRRGGLVAATIWPPAGAGFGAFLRPVFDLPGVVPPPDHSLPVDRDFERSPRGLSSVFSDAGLDDARATEIHWTWSVSADDLWAGISAGVATPGMTYLAQSRQMQARMTTRFFEAAGATSADGTLRFDARAVIATGRAT